MTTNTNKQSDFRTSGKRVWHDVSSRWPSITPQSMAGKMHKTLTILAVSLILSRGPNWSPQPVNREKPCVLLAVPFMNPTPILKGFFFYKKNISWKSIYRGSLFFLVIAINYSYFKLNLAWKSIIFYAFSNQT